MPDNTPLRDRRQKKRDELFEQFSYIDIEWSDVRVAFLRLQRHLLNDFVDQLPVLNAHLLAAICEHRPAQKTVESKSDRNQSMLGTTNLFL